jgi:hypothetical protein
MNNYLIITFVVLLVGAEAAGKAQPVAQHLPDHVAAHSREDQLAHQRSGVLGCDVRVVGVRGVHSHHRAELAQPTEQGGGAPLWGGRSCPQDP